MTEKKPLGYMLAKLHRLHMATVREKTKSLDIQPGHIPFLVTVLEHGKPMIQEDIAVHVLIDKSVVARGIEFLEKQGFLRRYVNPENRRQKLVEPTLKAQKIEKKLFEALKDANEYLLNALGSEDQTKIMDLLGHMLVYMENAP